VQLLQIFTTLNLIRNKERERFVRPMERELTDGRYENIRPFISDPSGVFKERSLVDYPFGCSGLRGHLAVMWMVRRHII
jgi:hypothetical protein